MVKKVCIVSLFICMIACTSPPVQDDVSSPVQDDNFSPSEKDSTIIPHDSVTIDIADTISIPDIITYNRKDKTDLLKAAHKVQTLCTVKSLLK